MLDQQRKGIGSELVREGLRRCKQLGCQAVVVLGPPEYYPRSGFVSATNHGIRTEYAVPQDVFMIAELETTVLAGASGVIYYNEAFRSF